MTLVVHLEWRAQEDIRELDYDRPEEVGAVMLGRDEGTRIVIERAVYCGTGDRHSVAVPLDCFTHLEEFYNLPPGRPETRLIGTLHSHPRYQGPRARKSDQDVHYWREAASALGSRVAGLILSPSAETDWRSPDWTQPPALSAWITEPSGAHASAVLVEEPEWLARLEAERAHVATVHKLREAHGNHA